MMMYYNLLYLFIIFIMMLIMFIPSNLIGFNPLTFNLLLVFYMIILSFKLNFFKNSYWYSYVLFLIMVGGLMILFIYFTSLTMNQLFILNLNVIMYFCMKIFLLLLFMIIIIYFNKEWLFNFIMIDSMNISLLNFFKKLNKFMYMNLMMDYNLMMTLYMIFYLFLTMLCSILICLKFYLPLRQLMKN